MTRNLTIDEAVAALKRGGVIAYPTEAVWGLGCDPFDEVAVTRLLAIKQRPVDKGLILVAANFDQLRPYLDLMPLSAERLGEVLATWPGPHTWVMPASRQAPRWITGAHRGIAVRVSAHPLVATLCTGFGGALVSTSANRAGDPPPDSLKGIDALLRELDGWIEGETSNLVRPTPIRDAATGAILRP